MLSRKRIPRYFFLFHLLAIVTPTIGTPIPHSFILQPFAGFVPSSMDTSDDHVFSKIPMSPEFDDSTVIHLEGHRGFRKDVDDSAPVLEPRLMGDTTCSPKFKTVDDFYCNHFTVLNNYLDALSAKHPRHSNLFKSLDGIASIREGKALAKRIIEESDRDRASVGITLRAQAVVFLHHWNTKPPSKPSSEGPDPTLSQSELTSIANDISKEENGTNVGKLLQEVNSCISDHIKKGKAEVAAGNKPGAKELGYEIAFAREASVLWFLTDGIREEAKEYRSTLSDKQPVKATAVTAPRGPRRNSA